MRAQTPRLAVLLMVSTAAHSAEAKDFNSVFVLAGLSYNVIFDGEIGKRPANKALENGFGFNTGLRIILAPYAFNFRYGRILYGAGAASPYQGLSQIKTSSDFFAVEIGAGMATEEVAFAFTFGSGIQFLRQAGFDSQDGSGSIEVMGPCLTETLMLTIRPTKWLGLGAEVTMLQTYAGIVNTTINGNEQSTPQDASATLYQITPALVLTLGM
jgi:hypothetical protein